MSIRELRLIGGPVLRTACERVTVFDESLARLVDDLLETVQLPGRAGLAAPQIGVGLAVFSYNVAGRLGYVINPHIVELTGTYIGPEGCLSLPGATAETPRAAFAVVDGVDINEQPIRVEGEGEFARCLQHETDHLTGLLYIDRLGRADRAAVLRQVQSR